ncbi:MAG: molybdopterin-dependent oxidoreductase [Anaerolineales bacterium]|nr:molybdopterin-dependent oxidoreductase [Anaerolineales bacterium]
MEKQEHDPPRAQDPLRPHRHDPNPDPPSADADFVVVLPNGRFQTVTLAALYKLPATTVPNYKIASTGHEASGPFAFTGVTLLDFVQAHWPHPWTQIEIVSADGFGNRVFADELQFLESFGPVLLAYAIDGLPMSRLQGLVRMIVPSERDDALRQVKWIGRIAIRQDVRVF